MTQIKLDGSSLFSRSAYVTNSHLDSVEITNLYDELYKLHWLELSYAELVYEVTKANKSGSLASTYVPSNNYRISLSANYVMITVWDNTSGDNYINIIFNRLYVTPIFISHLCVPTGFKGHNYQLQVLHETKLCEEDISIVTKRNSYVTKVEATVGNDFLGFFDFSK